MKYVSTRIIFSEGKRKSCFFYSNNVFIIINYNYGITGNYVQAVASQDFNFNNDAYNALCSTDDYDKMVICQNNLLEVADKCYESCHDQYCQLKCSESFYESLDGEFIS